MPAPASIDAGLADGTYKHAYEPPPAWGADGQGEWCNLSYYVPFEYRADFVRQALGVSRPLDGGNGWEINAPRPCELPGTDGLYGFGYSGHAVGELVTNQDGDPIAFSDTILTIQYRTPFYNWSGGQDDPYFLHSVSPDPAENELLLWATQEVDTRHETIMLPNREMVWATGENKGSPVGAQFSTDVSYRDISITYQRVPYMVRGLDTYDNHLNAATFLGQPAGHVWFRGYRTASKSWVGGIRTKTLQLMFSIRDEADWNERKDKDMEWNLAGVPAGGSDYDYASGDPDDYYRLPKRYKDFTNLLRLQFLAQSIPPIPRA